MNRNFRYKDVNEALPNLMGALLEYGTSIGSRDGATRELTHVGITLEKPLNRELLLPGRKANVAAQIAETMWVLSGRGDVEWLSHYLPRAPQFSDDGKVWRGAYGPRLRDWQGTVDQLKHVVELLKVDPDTRRAVMSVYDPMIDVHPGKDIPCNDFLSFLLRNGELDLHVFVRSNDAMWGWSGINAFEWSALLEVVAGLVGVAVGSLHFSVASFHLYDRHFEKAAIVAESRGATGYTSSPRFAGVSSVGQLDDVIEQWFQGEYLIRTGSSLAGRYVAEFPEPMMQSWLRVLQWWWGDDAALDSLNGTRLVGAVNYSVSPKRAPKVLPPPPVCSGFLEYANTLHADKHAAYGDSWCRRGEMLGIMANIARKIDRLGTGGETTDETSADTALDLMIYLAKYHCWLNGGDGNPEQVAELLLKVSLDTRDVVVEQLELHLTSMFTALEDLVTRQVEDRDTFVVRMLCGAYDLANALWSEEG